MKTQTQFSLSEMPSEISLIEEVDDKENDWVLLFLTTDFSFSAFLFECLNTDFFRIKTSFLLRKITDLLDYLLLLVLGPPIYS